MNKLERVARAICWKNGMNPDLTLGGDGENFLWHEYKPQAEAAIEAYEASVLDTAMGVKTMEENGLLPIKETQE